MHLTSRRGRSGRGNGTSRGRVRSADRSADALLAGTDLDPAEDVGAVPPLEGFAGGAAGGGWAQQEEAAAATEAAAAAAADDRMDAAFLSADEQGLTHTRGGRAARRWLSDRLAGAAREAGQWETPTSARSHGSGGRAEWEGSLKSVEAFVGGGGDGDSAAPLQAAGGSQAPSSSLAVDGMMIDD